MLWIDLELVGSCQSPSMSIQLAPALFRSENRFVESGEDDCVSEVVVLVGVVIAVVAEGGSVDSDDSLIDVLEPLPCFCKSLYNLFRIRSRA